MGLKYVSQQIITALSCGHGWIASVLCREIKAGRIEYILQELPGSKTRLQSTRSNKPDLSDPNSTPPKKAFFGGFSSNHHQRTTGYLAVVAPVYAWRSCTRVYRRRNVFRQRRGTPLAATAASVGAVSYPFGRNVNAQNN
jgi:hypothetical protein